jgi:hypothetical protein
MGRSTLIAVAAALLAVAAFASHSCSNDVDQTIVQADGGQICNFANAPCTGGLACINSICTQSCAAGAVCPTGSYCEGDAGFDDVCAPNAAIACATPSDCPAPQGCLSGLCVSNELLADGGRGNCSLTPPNDGCAAEALCFQIGATVACVGLPACSQDGTCPVGGQGATCNVQSDGGRLLDGKQRICLSGFCAATKDCPTSFPHCVTSGDGGIENSGCFAGTTGSPCSSNADCVANATCKGADAGVLGLCP